MREIKDASCRCLEVVNRKHILCWMKHDFEQRHARTQS